MERRLRRGDRVLCVSMDQHGIVQRPKGDRVLVYWGTQQEKQGPITTWVPRLDLVYEEYPHADL